jgi:hypothetical protein
LLDSALVLKTSGFILFAIGSLQAARHNNRMTLCLPEPIQLRTQPKDL